MTAARRSQARPWLMDRASRKLDLTWPVTKRVLRASEVAADHFSAVPDRLLGLIDLARRALATAMSTAGALRPEGGRTASTRYNLPSFDWRLALP